MGSLSCTMVFCVWKAYVRLWKTFRGVHFSHNSATSTDDAASTHRDNSSSPYLDPRSSTSSSSEAVVFPRRKIEYSVKNLPPLVNQVCLAGIKLINLAEHVDYFKENMMLG